MSSIDEEELSDVQFTCVSHRDLQGQESDPKYVTFTLPHTPPTTLCLHSYDLEKPRKAISSQKHSALPVSTI